ncbi:hypothetical protein EV182_005867, partial [Spiromyces aspiralis]
NVPGTSLYFYFLNHIRRIFERIEHPGHYDHHGTLSQAATTRVPLSATSTVFTGALTRAVAGFAMMPATVVKVRYEVSPLGPLNVGLQEQAETATL